MGKYTKKQRDKIVADIETDVVPFENREHAVTKARLKASIASAPALLQKLAEDSDGLRTLTEIEKEAFLDEAKKRIDRVRAEEAKNGNSD